VREELSSLALVLPTAVERSDMLARMALKTIEANADMCADCKLAVTTFAQLKSSTFDVGAQADVLVTGARCSIRRSHKNVHAACFLTSNSMHFADMFDHTFVGMQVCHSLRAAQQSMLLSPDVKVLPSRAIIRACLIERRLTDVAGFDLRAMNAYRWHPLAEVLDTSRDSGHIVLSEPSVCCDIELRKWLSDGGRSAAQQMDFTVTSDGTWNGVAVWYDLDFGEGLTISSAECSSIRTAVFYVDEQRVRMGDIMRVHFSLHEGHLVFQGDTSRQRPRHAIVPSWHFDMLNDHMRNEAYNRAITRAVDRRKLSSRQARHHDIALCRLSTDSLLYQVTVLDAGTGSGLLGMMAARAGADNIIGVEMSPHMCTVADETVARNGFAGRMVVLNKDVRSVFTSESDGLRGGRKPDGSHPELQRKADILLLEVFDSGLIGEGALHIMHAAHTRLLAPDAQVVPAAARVFCQLVEWRVELVQGVNVESLNRYDWRPDYEGVELSNVPRNQWRPLSEPMRVFDFDFHHVNGGSTKQLSTTASASGTVNAVVMWFDLQLDEEEVLSTNPYIPGKGPTWQQAIQFVQGVAIHQGDPVCIQAENDSYSISFKVRWASLPNCKKPSLMPPA
jgi:predicted RNA methylase